MRMIDSGATLRQHLIDPELCIRCNTCEETCPAGAVLHDYRNYVVDAQRCNGCGECVAPCPTGAIDNWRPVPGGEVYGVDVQLGWDALPPLSTPGDASGAGPCKRSHPATGIVVANTRLTAPSANAEIRQLTLDLSGQDFDFLEGQSVGLVPPGQDADGKPHRMRLYSVASARDGEAGEAGHLALIVKRVTPAGGGAPVPGLCSNYVCDLAPGQPVEVLGPFGDSFVMPADDATALLMICTGTGIAPMRAMLERRLQAGRAGSGELVLVYGVRTIDEAACHAELARHASSAPGLDLHIAYSRQPGQPSRYVQHVLLEQHDAVARLLADGRSCIYLCGLKGMEAGVLAAFDQVCRRHGMDWETLRSSLTAQSRLHIETY
jgi:benzoyl-CoA 2,3-dioxygenase component A